MRKSLIIVPAVGLFLVVLLASGKREFEAHGIVGGYRIETKVDHEAARAYVTGGELPEALESARRVHLLEGTVPSREEFAHITRTYSADTAALLFLETVGAQPANRQIHAEYAAAVRAAKREDPSWLSIPHSLSVLFVPGWLYQANGAETGSNFLEPRRLLGQQGVHTRLAPTLENGSVEENARIVAAEIHTAVANGRQLVVVSASKSGAEVAQALGLLIDADTSSQVLAWLSIGGVLRGSPVADAVVNTAFCSIARLQLAIGGFGMQGLLSMQTARQREVFDRLALPEHILYLSYVPVPLSGDVSRRGRLFYHATRAAGPGDGLTLLADELIPGGLALLEPGVDHFLEHPEKDLRTQALFRVVMHRLGFAAH